MKLHIDTTFDTTQTVIVDDSHHSVQDNINILSVIDDIADVHIERPEITVNPGPGVRFTKTRLGVVTANALSFALEKTVNGKQFEVPIYHKQPNITKPKK